MKILFLSAWFPSPADNGSKIRIYHLLRVLAQRHETTLLSFFDSSETIEPNGLAAYCRVAGIVPINKFQSRRWKAILGFFNSTPRSIVDTYSSEMDRLVRRELDSDQYDVLIASEISTAAYVPIHTRIPAIFEEVETSMIRDGAVRASDRLSRLRRALTWYKTKRYLARQLNRFVACTVVSPQERQHLREVAPNFDRVEIIPNGAEIEWMNPIASTPHRNELIFTGALTYSANYDAMRYFLTDILPRIKSAVPDVSLKITGRTEGVTIDQLPNFASVNWTGYLTDVRLAVAEAWACIVPLRLGGGTRLKILEAMALGTPVITTSKGAEGLEVVHGRDLLIADSPIEFAEQTVCLLRDPALRAQLADHGRQLVRSKYNWQSIGEKFNQFIESVADSKNSSL